MKRLILYLAVIATGVGWAADVPTYSLGYPPVTPINLTPNETENAWLAAASNRTYVAMSACATNAAHSSTNSVRIDGEAYTLAAAEAGYSWERLKPEYFLSDRIDAPEDVDWHATYARYRSDAEEDPANAAAFLFNTSEDDPCIYATDGGAHVINWVLKDGTVKEMTYVIGSVCQGRPKRIYWTDPPYNSPKISLQGKFVQFFGNAAIVNPRYEMVSNTTGGVMTEPQKQIVEGLYLDRESMVLEARGKLTGQVLMVYYDSGNYDSILCVQTLEVCQPDVIVRPGTIGGKLTPDGRGYNIEGLTAQVAAGIGDAPDDRGDYLYQHAGQHSYSPKNREVFALRPTEGERWKAEIYWMETDPMDVKWPFEVDQYNIDWPTDIQRYVRGDLAGDVGAPIMIPADYMAELQPYQEPDGHARAVDAEGRFETVGAGKSLLKISGDDNVWFLPIESVLRSDRTQYTLKSEASNVGLELMVRDGSASGVAEGARPFAARQTVPGYVYRPGTPKANYDVNLYSETNDASVVYAVSTNGDIEVWWSELFQPDDLPTAIAVPALPQVYTPIWPEIDEAPQIVIASQKGSANEMKYAHHGAASFDSANATLRLPDRRYFPDGNGTLMFWTRGGHVRGVPGADANPGKVFTLGRDAFGEGRPVLEASIEGSPGNFLFVSDTSVMRFALPPAERANEWVHVAVVFSNGIYTVCLNGQAVTNGTLAAAVDWSRPLAGNSFGMSRLGEAAPIGREVAEITMVRKALSPEEIDKRRFRLLSGEEGDVSGYFSFRPGEDLVPIRQKSGEYARVFSDRVGGLECLALDTLFRQPGAPMRGAAVIAADETPRIYVQNDKAADGFNPNDEHAFVSTAAGGYVTYALRCDLATDETPPPGVFVEYVQDGRNRLQFYHVIVTNETWTALEGECYAGEILPGPHPLTDFPDPWLKDDYWDLAANGAPGVGYRDRKNQIWARAAGDLTIHMYYAMQEGFYFPQLKTQPAVGEPVPWLSLLGASGEKNPLAERPAPWTWHAKWPENVAEMKIGQTLTAAENLLPEVWNAKSMAVVYPIAGRGVADVATDQAPVRLTDPTVMQSVPFDSTDLSEKYGLTTDPNGGLTQKSGKYHFTDLPPSLSSRLYADSTNKKLCFVGERVEKNAGVTVLYPNVMTAAERTAVEGLARDNRQGWRELVRELATAVVEPNDVGTVSAGAEVRTSYRAVDHYALTALGPTNYVVVIENDASANRMLGGASCPVNAGDTINMHVFKVVPEYYTGRIVTREDEVNLLSQQLSVLYTDPIGGEADDFLFEWRYASPNADGTVPENYDGTGHGNAYALRAPKTGAGEPADGAGLTRFVVGQQGDTLANMVNTYWICRYRAKEGTPAYAVMGDAWSGWCAPPALAEGWVQRVLNNVTPFNQRMTDLYESKAETAVSMIQQAGAPFTGDVALNQDNLTSVGLIQLYETILNKAETLSIANPNSSANIDVAKQLQLAAERLGDLYKVLGDEAYSDAKNPTIGFGETQDGKEKVGSGFEASSLFCFDNQVRTLLDEELCLLRGRSKVSAPTWKTGPFYNRLVWNFTKGITAGEVAYAVNYDVGGTETVALSEEQAARLYPQGHGDAYGHYLSALKVWYRLLRNPNFAWFRPSQTEMNVADSAVNVDYYEEAKFAEAAADLARTAADVVDLSARKAWRDGGESGSGYLDSDADTAFGYGEWASRGGYGALVNWATANSLLPRDCTKDAAGFNDPATDKGLTRIDRGTVDELRDICESAANVMRAVDRLDAGLNPLGLSDDAVPFDIAPQGVADGSNTHFEQVRDRAKTALANARKVLERAQTQAARMRLIEEAASDYKSSIDQEEENYDIQLIGFFGTPYSDDIGPGKTYRQGYAGPDLIHYMWMDLDQYGLTELEDTVSHKAWYYADLGGFRLDWYKHITAIGGDINHDLANLKSDTQTLFCEVSASGIFLKPASIAGRRAMRGTIQERYGELLSAYAAAKKACKYFDEAVGNLEGAQSCQGVMASLYVVELLAKEAASLAGVVSDYKQAGISLALNALDWAAAESDVAEAINLCLPDTVGAGMTVVTSPRSLAYAAVTASHSTKDLTLAQTRYMLKNKQITDNILLIEANRIEDQIMAGVNYHNELRDMLNDIKSHAEKLNAAYFDLMNAFTTLNTCVERVNAEVAKAEQVLDRRENARKRQVDKLSQYRYNEMLFRRIRDKALTRYSAAFDLAQKYVFMAAQVYDYETALKRGEAGAGDAFISKIVATRQLGAFDADGEPVVADDGDLGLSGYLAQMDANWQVLKPRLGINNPQPYATWFSLRTELFRILSGTEGDAAWRKALRAAVVTDLRTLPDYVRFCSPFQGAGSLALKEPGFVIEFPSSIDFAKNFFGRDLSGNDHYYDSSWFATRILSAGVFFENYNAKLGDSKASGVLGSTPVAYLIPAGQDRMRAPGTDDGEAQTWTVIDQVIPAPYPVGAAELASSDWFPYEGGETAGADAAARIRRYPSFRAYGGAEPDDAMLDAVRLTGRSVWNTRWLLIIPAGALHTDRETALDAFIDGVDTDRDGAKDISGVTDIRIGFKTYSHSGR